MSFFYQNRKEQLYLYLSNNNPYAVHLHRQLELIYVLSGSTTVTVEQQEFPLTPGQGVLVFPNQMHGLKHVDPGQNLLCIFEPDFCHSFRHFFQNKKPSRNDFAISTLSEHSHIALQGLEALASTMEKDRPTPSDVQIYAEGYLTLLLADLLPSLPLQTRKARRIWSWSRGCFSIWMPTTRRNCPWTVSRKNSVSAVLSSPGYLRKSSTPLSRIM